MTLNKYSTLDQVEVTSLNCRTSYTPPTKAVAVKMAVRVAARGSLLYLGAVNAGSAVLFGYDKIQAQNGGWRVREADLCKSALLGGWIGGFLAMHMFRHKTQKQVRVLY